MREKIRDKGRLQHIISAMDYVNQFLEGQTFETFSTNAMMYFAIVKNIEIIGEAAYMLTNEFRESHPEIPWREIIAMRHVLVHGYYQLSQQEVWDTAQNNLPELRIKIENLITELGTSE